MIPYAVEIVIAIGIALFDAALAVYILILRKNGWIGRTSNYRCLNPQCKKILQKPLKVKDFSNKRQFHFACPECGYDLDFANIEKAWRSIFQLIQLKLLGKRALKETTPRRELESKIEDSTSKPIETRVSMTNNDSKEPKAPKSNLLPAAESKENQSLSEISPRLLEQKSDGIKKEGPTGCNHHFGYLASLSKGTIIPDDCYSCSKLIECCIARAQNSIL